MSLRELQDAADSFFVFSFPSANHLPLPSPKLNISTKLTEDNFEKTVQAEIDAGKTFFVRWIASAG